MAIKVAVRKQGGFAVGHCKSVISGHAAPHAHGVLRILRSDRYQAYFTRFTEGSDGLFLLGLGKVYVMKVFATNAVGQLGFFCRRVEAVSSHLPLLSYQCWARVLMLLSILTDVLDMHTFA